MAENWLTESIDKLKEIKKVLGEAFYGFTVHELDIKMRKERGHTENLFMLMIFDDIVGLPLLPPYCSLRFYPYIIPGIEGWKKRIQRKKDLTDFITGDLN